ncbi:hypothetical protein NE237_003257 [Protea cynaroides]|uniref:Non-haem dioxygenase N-terminal domain-containing protein n=1 Tax=Protea cynaroides TaxID=273540 RepID=A0A9Q0KGD4_9MAGN|nr:hypothetical protein NE237_003257 [Protea cynaroides]
MAETFSLPVIDLSSSDRMSTAKSIRRACVDHGFFYLVNHGVGEELFKRLFEESKKLFLLPLEQKMKLARNENRGYTPFYAEKLDTSLNSRGDLKETFYIGPIEGTMTLTNLNQWPSEEALPFWRLTMESYYREVLTVGKSLISLIALALNLEENFFEKIGALDAPMSFVRLLHYPGELAFSNEETYGASAHSDYGMITLLATELLLIQIME